MKTHSDAGVAGASVFRRHMLPPLRRHRWLVVGVLLVGLSGGEVVAYVGLTAPLQHLCAGFTLWGDASASLWCIGAVLEAPIITPAPQKVNANVPPR